MKNIFETFFCGFKMLIFQGVMLIFMMQVSYKLLDNTLGDEQMSKGWLCSILDDIDDC